MSFISEISGPKVLQTRLKVVCSLIIAINMLTSLLRRQQKMFVLEGVKYMNNL